MDELFPAKEMEKESPRVEWMRRLDLKTKYSPGVDEPWSVWQGAWSEDKWQQTGETGTTVEGALVNWAKLNGVKLWNEESTPGPQTAPRTQWKEPEL